ncbi:hypothetical protein [Streptomyces sp. NRRL F-4489]|uniref:hypothetical protein n=1 Tax=Streptomyces sp. NRRL F-4489 TaxID=1609095 RepID=UPI0018FE4C69|nr:hypothetical protein [Streptomyces sp. NRRL F-4489]
MPLQNRVTPYGEIEAVASRGTMLGNRGRLHNQQQELIRSWRTTNWISCRLQFRGRQRQVMGPASYTELFFLDEATSFAAGHRPCSECRNADYLRFKKAWMTAYGLNHLPSAHTIDHALARDRLDPGRSRQIRHDQDRDALPDGTMIQWQDAPWLVWGARIFRWTHDGYTEAVTRHSLPQQATVLTPRCTVRVLQAGYRPLVHETVGSSCPTAKEATEEKAARS